jgi:hypothetical protein
MPSTLQVIISRVQEAHCGTETDDIEDHCIAEVIHSDEQIDVDDNECNDDIIPIDKKKCKRTNTEFYT